MESVTYEVYEPTLDDSRRCTHWEACVASFPCPVNHSLEACMLDQLQMMLLCGEMCDLMGWDAKGEWCASLLVVGSIIATCTSVLTRQLKIQQRHDNK